LQREALSPVTLNLGSYDKPNSIALYFSHEKGDFSSYTHTFFASFCISGFFLVKHTLQLPFRSTNDALHKKGSAFNLDFLIPSGSYLDEKTTIGEVIEIRTKKEASLYDKMVRTFSDLIPVRYRYPADILLFLFWSLSFMTFFRVFTGKCILDPQAKFLYILPSKKESLSCR